MSYFRKKKIDEPKSRHMMERHLTAKDLIVLGLGAIVGTGIFVITGTAAANTAGPALSLSFVLAAVVIILSGLCFAEFAARIPVIGGPYAYMSVVFGEFIGWMTGWLVLCEFFLAVSSVASGWSGYVHGFLDGLDLPFPQALSAAYYPAQGTYVDIIAVLVLLLVTWLVSLEAKQALRLNGIMLFVKFGLIAIFVVLGMFYMKTDNWQPFLPKGFGGVLQGAGLVYFAFLGFDSVSMAAEEVIEPQKNVPRGIIGSIIISTILYIIVTLVLTGMVPYTSLNVKDPVAFAMRFVGHKNIGALISIGAIMTLLTVCISMMYSLSRMVYALAKDGLLPQSLARLDPKRHNPKRATWILGVLTMIFAGIFPLQVLAEITNLSALVYLFMMAVGILKIRKDMGKPAHGEFQVPLVPIVPILSMLMCVLLMTQLSKATWIVFVIWTIIGWLIYVFYGHAHSIMNEEIKEEIR
ncbi:MAG: amino acid permease [Enterococcaceae bacterium]|jgi:APA family basic amino acid/polyamine antiporter|nr:amino acid permease [Enterococcaceae bacterium]MCI1919404.1 amino acid permease [Enterococcaceae bacterium]